MEIPVLGEYLGYIASSVAIASAVIFTVKWMFNKLLDKVNKNTTELNKKFDDLHAELTKDMTEIRKESKLAQQRIDQVNVRMDQVNARMDQIYQMFLGFMQNKSPKMDP